MNTKDRDRKNIPEINALRVIIEAIAEQPRTARALAALNLPVNTESIEAAGLPFRLWQSRSRVTIDTGCGPILTSKAWEYLQQTMTLPELLIAHRDCVAMLNHQISIMGMIDELLVEQRAFHASKVGLKNQALADVNWLCARYKKDDRPLAVRKIMEMTGLDPLELTPAAQQVLRWARLLR